MIPQSLQDSSRYYQALQVGNPLRALSEAEFGELLQVSRGVEFADGEVVFRQGEVASNVILVVEGELRITSRAGDGTTHEVGRVAAGNLLGEVAFFTGGLRTADVTALGSARVMEIPGETFRATFTQHEAFRQQLRSVATERIQSAFRLPALRQLFGERAPENALVELNERSALRQVRRGEMIFRQDDPAEEALVVLSGRIRILLADGRTRDATRGVSVGELALIDGAPRSASVMAVRDTTLMVLKRSDFDEVKARYPVLLESIAQCVVSWLRQSGEKLENQNPKVFALIPVSGTMPSGMGEQFQRSLQKLAPAKLISHHTVDAALGREGAADAEDSDPLSLLRSMWLEEQDAAGDLLILQADINDSPWAQTCVGWADHVLLVGDANSSQDTIAWPQALQEERSLEQSSFALALLHEADTRQPQHTARWLDGLQLERWTHVRKENEADFDRLARISAGHAVTLVLGGGGARGAAQVGMLRAFAEAGLPIDAVGGTSIGGQIGVQVAMGRSPAEILKQARIAFVKINPFRGFSVPIISLFGPKRLNRVRKKVFGKLQLEDLWISAFTVSCDLVSGDRIVHRRGDVGRAAVATASLPALLPPTLLEGGVLVDGGVVDNLPVQVMRDLVQGVTIACNISSESSVEAPPTADLPSGGKVLWSRLSPFRKPLQVPTMGAMLVRLVTLRDQDTLAAGLPRNTYLLRPNVEGIGMLEFEKMYELEEIGYQHAREHLDAWKNDPGSPLRPWLAS